MPAAAKPRYEILDGLRGVAALIVVAFHLFETYAASSAEQILNHGYLAVDFFFMLSGFVVGYAYDDRWGVMTIRGFFKRRLTRLQPMVVVGTLVGAALFYFTDAPAFPLVGRTPWWELLIVMLLGCLMIPTPPSMDIRGWSEINSLNGAQWSLMWEYIANVLYATVVRRFSRGALALLVALSALLTLDLCFDVDVFGLLEVRSGVAYTVIGGFGLSPDQVYIGLARLFYPFFGGLLLFRLGKRIRIGHGGFWWCSVALAAILVTPYCGTDRMPWLNGLYCAVAILLLMPAIVAAGAGSRISGRRSAAVCRFLGDISYPLYITHYPLIYLQMTWAAGHADAPLSTHIFVAVALFCTAVAVAYAFLKLYDEPVRAWLRDHWLSSKSAGSGASVS